MKIHALDLRSVAAALGGQVSGDQILCPGPGHSRRDRSLSVWLDPHAPEGFSVHSHADDDPLVCRDYVRQALGLTAWQPGRSVSPPVRRRAPAPAPRDDRARTQRALALWHEAIPIEGTPAETYLASRGVPYHGEALRWHPSCPFEQDRLGCMLGLVRNIVTDELQAIHRTVLDAAGRKLSHLGNNGRLSLGPTGGGAVKLTADEDVTTVIAIGEGIETILSVWKLPDLAGMPVWSVLSAGGVRAFPALPGIESVWIAADTDVSGTGQAAAKAAEDRLNTEGIETIILAPTATGADLNDRVLRHA